MARKRTTSTSSSNDDSGSGETTVSSTASASSTAPTGARRFEITYPNGATEVVFQESRAVRAQAEHGGSYRELSPAE